MVDQPIQANIAIESDYEFYSQFRTAADPVAEAINYIASLIGCDWLSEVFSKQYQWISRRLWAEWSNRHGAWARLAGPRAVRA